MTRRIFFSVGEPSGDLHAAGLIRELRKLDPTICAEGFGGPKMVEQGFDQHFDLTQLAVVGFVEVLPKLREFFRLKAQARHAFSKQQYDAVVVVDMPGFNWHIAAEAKKAGIPVFYYMPPQLWAWGQWRIHKMKRNVDHVLCALPVEQRYFQSHGMDATLVGHPFFEHVDSHPIDRNWVTDKHRENTSRLAILPGSRRRELMSIFPLQLEVLQQLHKDFPNYAFDVGCLNQKHSEIVRSIYREKTLQELPIEFHVNKTSEVIDASTCVLMKSGSVSLELLARRKPACVMYHASYSTYAIARMLTSVKHFSLPNIIANDEVVPEFLAIGKSRSILKKVIAETSNLMSSENARNRQVARLDSVRMLCGGNQAACNAAFAIQDRLRWSLKARSAA